MLSAPLSPFPLLISRAHTRRLQLHAQLRRARTLRASLEEAATLAESLPSSEPSSSYPRAMSILQSSLGDINRLVRLTEALRNKHTFDNPEVEYEEWNEWCKEKNDVEEDTRKREQRILRRQLRGFAKEKNPNLEMDDELEKRHDGLISKKPWEEENDGEVDWKMGADSAEYDGTSGSASENESEQRAPLPPQSTKYDTDTENDDQRRVRKQPIREREEGRLGAINTTVPPLDADEDDEAPLSSLATRNQTPKAAVGSGSVGSGIAKKARVEDSNKPKAAAVTTTATISDVNKKPPSRKDPPEAIRSSSNNSSGGGGGTPPPTTTASELPKKKAHPTTKSKKLFGKKLEIVTIKKEKSHDHHHANDNNNANSPPSNTSPSPSTSKTILTTVAASKTKGGGPRPFKKCHQCKNSTRRYRSCNYWKLTGKCRKVFCIDCLSSLYTLGDDVEVPPQKQKTNTNKTNSPINYIKKSKNTYSPHSHSSDYYSSSPQYHPLRPLVATPPYASFPSPPPFYVVSHMPCIDKH